jgi:uncharacterized protein (DUF2164 family)
MSKNRGDIPTQIELSDERKKKVLLLLKGFYSEDFDQELSPFQAERLLEFFMRALGPPLYNQAIADARASMQEKLDDLDSEFY